MGAARGVSSPQDFGSHDRRLLPPTFYSVLGVAPNAEDCIIRAAYRALCQQHHPDT
jgi:DnaJ-class molecular chaperone